MQMSYEFCADVALVMLPDSDRKASVSTTKHTQPPITMKNRSKIAPAILATGLLSCTLFNQQARATEILHPAVNITGHFNLAGSAHFDTTSLATATRVLSWVNPHAEAGSTGVFSGIPVNTAVTMSPWTFNPSTATPGLWSVAGFTFDLLSSTVVVQNAFALVITGNGIVSGNGFTPTAMQWAFAATSSGGLRRAIFSFSGSGSAGTVPEGGTAVALLGIALIGIEALRRKLRIT